MDLGWFWYPLLLVISVEKSVVLFIVFAVLHHISCSCSLLLCFETSQRQRVHVNAVILPMTWHRDFSVLRVIWSVPSMTWGHGLKSWQTSNFAAGLLHRAAPLCCGCGNRYGNGMETVWKRYGVETIVIFVSHTDLGQWLRGWLATTYHYLVNSSFGYKTIKHHHISSNGTDFWAKSSLYRKIQKVPCVGAPRIPGFSTIAQCTASRHGRYGHPRTWWTRRKCRNSSRSWKARSSPFLLGQSGRNTYGIIWIIYVMLGKI